jgi:hypothetical protein
MTMRVLLMVLALPLASLRAQEPMPTAACDPIASDSARFGPAPVFAACEVDRAARLRGRPQASGVTFPVGVTCLSAEYEFVVDERGAPVVESAKLLFASTPEYGAAVRTMLARVRYAPAQRQRTPVRQLVAERFSQQEVDLSERRVPFTVVTVTPGAGQAALPPARPMSAPPSARPQTQTRTGPCP